MINVSYSYNTVATASIYGFPGPLYQYSTNFLLSNPLATFPHIYHRDNDPR